MRKKKSITNYPLVIIISIKKFHNFVLNFKKFGQQKTNGKISVLVKITSSCVFHVQLQF